jgi:Flp pilus assembly pilin Flp
MRNFAIKAASWAQARRQPREEGQTVIEYALVIAVVSLVLVAAIATMGSGLIADVKTKVDAAF